MEVVDKIDHDISLINFNIFIIEIILKAIKPFNLL
jgi:hypothetical protein